MNKRTVLKYLDKKNWKLKVDTYEALLELSGDYAEQGDEFKCDQDMLMSYPELAKLKWDDVLNEILIRSLLNGTLKAEYFHQFD